jgi:hypothetical protein
MFPLVRQFHRRHPTGRVASMDGARGEMFFKSKEPAWLFRLV